MTSSLSYDSFSNADIVIEAVFENIKIKHQVIKELEQVVPKHCIIATNTSAIPIEKISEGSSRPENVSLSDLNIGSNNHYSEYSINSFRVMPYNNSVFERMQLCKNQNATFPVVILPLVYEKCVVWVTDKKSFRHSIQ